MIVTLQAPAPPTTVPGGAVITIVGGPNATADIVGTHSDPADFYGIIIGLIAIFVTISWPVGCSEGAPVTGPVLGPWPRPVIRGPTTAVR